MQNNDEQKIVQDFIKALNNVTVESLKDNPTQQQKIALLLVRFYITRGFAPPGQASMVNGRNVVDREVARRAANTTLKPGIIALLQKQHLSEENFKKIEEIFKNVDLKAISNIHTNKDSYGHFREAIQPGYLQKEKGQEKTAQPIVKSPNTPFKKAALPSKKQSDIKIGNRTQPIPVPKRPYPYQARKPNPAQEQNVRKEPHQNQNRNVRTSGLFQPSNELQKKLDKQRAQIPTSPFGKKR